MYTLFHARPARETSAEYRRRIARFIHGVKPDYAAVEEVFFAVNAKSALKLSHVRGVALLTVAEAAVSFAEYSPLEVKMSVVGYGRAEKSQVQRMVASILQLREPIASEDACDALAIAICHATHVPMLILEARA